MVSRRLLEDGSNRLLEDGSFRLLDIDDTPPAPTPIPATGSPVEVFALPDFTPLDPQPVTVHGVSGQRERNGTGFGEFSIALDDPAAALIEPGLHVAAIRRTAPGGVGALLDDDDEPILDDDDEPILVDSGPVTVHTFEIEETLAHTIDEQGGAKQILTSRGRGSAVGLDRIKVWPSMGDRSLPKEIDAVHDWRRYQFDVDAAGFVAATEICTVNDASDLYDGSGVWPTQPMAEDFTFDTGAYMIWSADGTTMSATPGYALFVLDIEIEDGGRHGFEVLMDNDGFFWIDTVQMLEINQYDGYHRVSFKRVENLTAGVHRLSFAVRNIGPNPTVAGPGALAFNLFKTDQQDHPLEPFARYVSDSSVKVLHVAYDAWPGWGVGEILFEHRTKGFSYDDHAARSGRNLATWFNLDFTTSVDSNGDAWPTIDPGYVTKTGHTSLLNILEELEAEGLVSLWRVLPDGVTLQVYGPGYTEDSGASLVPSPMLDPSTGQIRLHDLRRT